MEAEGRDETADAMAIGTGRWLVWETAGWLLYVIACSMEPAPAQLDGKDSSEPIAVTSTLSPEVPEAGAVSQSAATHTPSPMLEPAVLTTATWRGLTIAAETRCAPYDTDDYSYSQSVENRIVDGMGGIVYGPYTGRHFSSTKETDIEHIVARSEAHDSGLCAADARTRPGPRDDAQLRC